METRSDDAIDESLLQDPLERPVFIASVALNFVLMALALTLVFYTPGWLKSHALLNKDMTRFLADSSHDPRRSSAFRCWCSIETAANRRCAVTQSGFQENRSSLRSYRNPVGSLPPPRDVRTARNLSPCQELDPAVLSNISTSWHEKYIVLHQNIFEIDDRKTMDVISLCYRSRAWGKFASIKRQSWNEMLLTYISLIKVAAQSAGPGSDHSRCDRYGAALAPTEFRGLLINAVGRRLMDRVNVEDYFAQLRHYEWILVRGERFLRAEAAGAHSPAPPAQPPATSTSPARRRSRCAGAAVPPSAVGRGWSPAPRPNDPTAVSSIAVVGAATGYGLAWLVVAAALPMLRDRSGDQLHPSPPYPG